MIRIAICDDDREYGAWLEMVIFQRFGSGVEITQYSSGEDYLVDAELMHELIFLDVEMPGWMESRLRRESERKIEMQY